MSRARDRADGVLHNRTHEDTEGGRESLITFKGEQSGGEISTLAQIQASHDGTADDEKADLIFKTNDGSDGSSPTEAMRIDSSRNVLIGTATPNPTSSSANTAGQEFSVTGGVRSTVDGNPSATFNRKTDDGDIAIFRKDGTTVASIGVASNDNISIGATTAGGAGFFLYGAGGTDPYVLPMKNGALSDNTVTLGDTTRRYKDLFLSGGAYIGGTVAANYLDDYEEGTWNVSLSGVTVSGGTVEATYVKVGNLVTCIASFTNVTISGGNTVTVTGLPFTAAIRSTTSHPALYYHGNGAEPVYLLLEKNTANMFFQYNRNNNSWASATVTSGSNRYIHFSITYTV